MPILTDCTDSLSLVYDRGPDGYGVPVPDVRFKGTSKLQGVLTDVRYDLVTIGWWGYIESVLTAGLWVDKKGAHGDGIAWDFDGVVLKLNPFEVYPKGIIFSYKNGISTAVEFNGRYYDFTPMLPRIKTRLACLLSLRFGVVLTAGYNKAHEDHIHADLSRTVKWRGSRSQRILVNEVCEAWDIDAVMVSTDSWLDWLKMIAFNPPKDVK